MAATYYIDGEIGDDSHNGLSENAAWKTLDAVNSRTFAPGDSVLLKRGTRFTGELSPKGSGDAAAPITLAAYGDGALPQVNGEGKVLDTLLLHNVEYWNVHDLEITNKGETTAPWRTGVHILANAQKVLHSIHVSGLYVHDVNGDLRKSDEGCGIYFETRSPRRTQAGTTTAVASTAPVSTQPASDVARFDDLIIENCHLVRTDRNGICQRTIGGPEYRSTRVVIRKNLLEDIGGDGIKLWGSNGGLIEGNVIRGAHVRCTDGAAGIWPFASDDTIIQFNEVSGVKSTIDGQGFDSDYQCRGSIFQYNYSHDNEGGFILVCSPGNSYCRDTIIRYNISQNDGGSHGSRVFQFAGNSSDTLVHNNIIYVGPGFDQPLIKFNEWNKGNSKRASFFNNIFYVDGRVTYVWGKSTGNVFDHNIFYGSHVGPPADPHALNHKPFFKNAGGASNGWNTLDAYFLSPGGELPHGQTVKNPGSHDFYGNPLRPDGAPVVGVQEQPIPTTMPRLHSSLDP